MILVFGNWVLIRQTKEVVAVDVELRLSRSVAPRVHPGGCSRRDHWGNGKEEG